MCQTNKTKTQITTRNRGNHPPNTEFKITAMNMLTRLERHWDELQRMTR